jgi:hypothetical protein
MGQWTGPEWPTANCGGDEPPTVCPHVCDESTNCTRNTPCSAEGCLFDIVQGVVPGLTLHERHAVALFECSTWLK